MTIDHKGWRPRLGTFPVRFVHASGAALTFGVETHRIEGVPVRIYSVAKTVADCFKYRSKVGLDVALEALRGCLSQRRATVDELWDAARVCRVAALMRPYIEALV
jgi:hypothetical protein